MTSNAPAAPRTARAAGHPAPARERVRLRTLWFGLAGGPAAWTFQTLVGVPVASHGCFPRLVPLATPITGGLRPVVVVVSLVALAACVAALAASLGAWRHTRDEQHQRAAGGAEPMTSLLDAGEGRTRFMAAAGVLASFTFLLLIIFQAATVFILASPCGG